MSKSTVGPAYAEWLRARGHYTAASALSESDNPDFFSHSGWQCQMLCACIEVALKAFLLAKNPPRQPNKGRRRRRRVQPREQTRDLLGIRSAS